MAAEYDQWLPVARKLIKGLSAKPGVHFADKEMTAQYAAQALNGMAKRGELTAATAAKDRCIMPEEQVPFGTVGARRLTLDHRERHFEVWLSDEGDWTVLEYTPEYSEDGDPEEGPSLHVEYWPAVLGQGYGMNPTEEGTRELIDRLLDDDGE